MIAAIPSCLGLIGIFVLLFFGLPNVNEYLIASSVFYVLGINLIDSAHWTLLGKKWKIFLPIHASWFTCFILYNCFRY